MERFNMYITKHEITTLEKLSNKTGLSVAELIRRAIDTYLEKNQ